MKNANISEGWIEGGTDNPIEFGTDIELFDVHCVGDESDSLTVLVKTDHPTNLLVCAYAVILDA